MPEFRIFETDQFLEDLRRVSKTGQGRVLAKLRAVVYPQLRRHPHLGPNVRQIKGFSPPTWRHRIGAWRFFYEIDEEERVVSMTAAEHRGAAY